MKMYLARPFKFMNIWNNKGFTFVEMIYAFSIFLMITLFFPIMLNVIYQNGKVDERLHRMEWEVFINQLKKEIRSSDEMSVKYNRLYLVKGEETVTYEFYQSKIRRRVNFQGHEVVLQNIKSVSFHEISQGVRMTVQDLYNGSETITLLPLIKGGV
jgi:competence protein ComGF